MKRKLIVAVCAAAMASMVSVSAAQAQPRPRQIEIDAKRFVYSPGDITLKVGQPVILVLKSEDVAHGLRIRELNINLKTTARGTAEVKFTPQKVGDFVGHCSVFCGERHGSMTIRIHVTA